jgi:hypothetical protein
MLYCAPSNSTNKGSCYDDEDLDLFIKLYNQKSNGNIDINISRIKKIKALLDVFSDKCGDDQICWLSHPIVRDSISNTDIEETTFRPKGPIQVRKWLSNYDILNTMIQYEEIFPTFHFIGAEPCNFLGLPRHERSVFDSEDLKKLYNNNKRKIGLILNTQGYEQGGEHWVSIYTDLDKNIIYYFDSNGDKPFKDAKVFITRIAHYLYNKLTDSNISYTEFVDNKDKYKDIMKQYIKFYWNDKEMQKEDGACGLFSMYTLLECVNDRPIEEIHKLTDNYVETWRKKIYRP